MTHWIVGGAVGLLGGVGIAVLNFAISRAVIRKKPSVYASFSMVRQLIHIGYLLLLFFIAPVTPWGRTELLIGGVIGMTVPMFLFTPWLMKEMKLSSPVAGEAGGEAKQGGSSGDVPPSAAEPLARQNGQDRIRQSPPGEEKKREDESEVSDRG